MSRDWKPGDVAIGKIHDWQGRVFYEGDGDWRDEDGSCWVEGETTVAGRDSFRIVRQLVVIDPEDREQVARLAGEFIQEADSLMAWQVAHMAHALRALLAPPRPEEPTGLGAVIKANDDDIYVSVGTHDGDSTWVNQRTGNAHSWLTVEAVQVLSEGWSE